MAKPAEKVSVTLGGRKVWYRIAGTGIPILVLPGWGGPTDAYFVLQDMLAAKGYAVALPDLPGLPGKTDPFFVPLDGWGAWIDGFAAATIGRPFVLISHSLSARVAMKYMAQHGPHCRCSILVDPWLVSSPFQSLLWRSAARMVRFLCPVVYPDMQWVLDRKAWASALSLLAPVRDQTKVRCLVLWGRRDVARRLITGWRRVSCESRQYEWGHSPQITAVSQLADIIDEFVRNGSPINPQSD